MRSLIIVLVAASHGAAALVAKKPSLRQPQLSSGSPSPRRARPSQLRRAAPTMGLADVAERPARAGMALAYVGFASAIATFPGDFSNPADTQMIMDAINDPSSLNPVRRNSADGPCASSEDARGDAPRRRVAAPTPRPPRNSHVVAAASPRLVSTQDPTS